MVGFSDNRVITKDHGREAIRGTIFVPGWIASWFPIRTTGAGGFLVLQGGKPFPSKSSTVTCCESAANKSMARVDHSQENARTGNHRMRWACNHSTALPDVVDSVQRNARVGHLK
jgi:hypothetical protein